jgi:hypothetical protein
LDNWSLKPMLREFDSLRGHKNKTMKKLILILLFGLTICFSSQAQLKDSVDNITTEQKVQNLEYNLDVFQQNRKTSISLLVGGLFVQSFGFYVYVNAINNNNNDAKKFGHVFNFIGSGLLISSWIISLDNGKWLTTKKRTRYKRQIPEWE